MIENSTVFVLGAGASWHYGYPTGDELVKSVTEMAERFSDYCKRRIQSGEVVQVIPEYVEQRIDASKGTHGAIEAWAKVSDECGLLIRRLQAVHPLLIDHFLAWNESLRPIGKLMIAAVILECEAAKGYRTPWHRFIVHKLVYGCSKSSDLFENDVQFITFNYDASLEYELYNALTSLDIIEKGDAEEFLTKDRIIHTYGCVHPSIPTSKDFVDASTARTLGNAFAKPLVFVNDFEPRKKFLDRCLSAAKNLRTIDPHDKEEDEALLGRARQWIEKAGVIYILGYGFDANNNRRIGLSAANHKVNKIAMFTNLGDLNTINKKASKLFFDDFVHFTNPVPHGNPTGSYFEKSIRNVYEAFAKDFEALEGELTGSTKI
jgi:hypothetical protein